MQSNQSGADLLWLEQLGRLVTQLSAETDATKLSEMVLSAVLELSSADAGVVYLQPTSERLCCESVKIDSLNLLLSGDDLVGRLPVISIPDERSDEESLLLKTFLDNRSFLIENVDASDHALSIHESFDHVFDYRTRHLLTVPLQGMPDKPLGVLQLMSPDSGSFSEQDQILIGHLSSIAGSMLWKNQQLDEQKILFESMIQMVAGAVDEKFYLGADHCRRVPILTMMLAQAVNHSSETPFAGQFFSERELYELEVAAWLHDCGKLVTPISLVDKAQKLETVFDRIDLIQTRFEIIRRDEEIARLRAGLNGGDLPILVDGQNRSQQTLEDLHFLCICNHGKKRLSQADQKRIQEIADRYRWVDRQREEVSVLTEDEVANLAIETGTLTERERIKVNNHALATVGMLDLLPFPEELKLVPEIIGGYHEARDEKPLLQTCILAIADIFVAVTAENRPCRKTNSLDEAMEILFAMRDAGQLDAALLDLFFSERLHQQYAADFLSDDQIGFSLPN